ncbi:MAG: hypothetical protein WC985_07095 [Thermoplasmata archaeon]
MTLHAFRRRSVASMRTEGPGSHRTPRALSLTSVWIAHNDWAQWRELAAADFAGTRRKVVIDGRRTLNREALESVDLIVLGG